MARAPHATPPAADALVGRAGDLDALTDRFAEGARLVTITGPGGIGKTRLALAFAAQSDERLALGPALFCDLSAARDERDFCTAVAVALGVALPADDGAAAALLGAALAAHTAGLVVLDNFEQLPAPCAVALGRWLARAPSLRVLVTARERLRLAHERVYELAPLALAPDADGDASPAVELLLARARAARPEYAPDAAERQALAAIARRLDGLPLALELAAARMNTLGAATILARLEQRLPVLGRGPRDAAARQATLRDAMDWSWQLLEPHERAAWAQLAAFRGEFALEAAERVVDLAAFPAAPPALDVLQSLRDKSVLAARDAPAGELRYAMLLTVAEYAADRLARDFDAPGAFLRHARCFAELALRAEEDLTERGELAALGRLEAMRDNLLAAAERLRDAPADLAWVGAAAGVLAGLATLHSASQPVAGLAALFDAPLAAAERAGAPLALRAALLARRANVRRLQGAAGEARAELEQAAAMAERAGDLPQLARACNVIAGVSLQLGQVSAAEAAARRAEEVARAAGRPAAAATAILLRGRALHHAGRVEDARAATERARREFHAIGHPYREAQLLIDTASELLDAGQFAAARASLERAIELQRAHAVPAFMFNAEVLMGQIAQAEGELDAAAQWYERAGRRPRLEAWIAQLLCATARLEQGRADEACALLEQASGAAFEQQLYRRLLEPYRAAALAASGDLQGARAVLAATEAPQGPEPADAAARLVRAAAAVRAAPAGAGEAARAALAEQMRAATASGPGERPLAERSLEVCVALRLAQRALDAPPPSAGPPPLEVHAALDSFRVPGGARVYLGRRKVLRALLEVLVRARGESPGRAVPTSALLEAAWPGDRSPLASRKNRLGFALSELRTLGLRAVLLTTDAGYLLDPNVPLAWSRDGVQPAHEEAPR